MLSIKRVFTILLFLELINLGVRETIDPDMWWHLATGRLIWEDGIPRQDPFSFTVAGGPWTTHEWLSELIMWAAYLIGGLPLVALVFAIFSGLAFWLVYLCSPGRPYLAGAVVMLSSFAASPSFGVRCQVLNMLLMATFVFVVERVRNGELSRTALYGLPLLTVLWVNLHSGFLLGVVLLLTYAAGEFLTSLSADAATSRAAATANALRPLWQLLAIIAVACLLASVANPAGPYIWYYPFETLGSDLMQRNIVEWASPDFHQKMYWPFAALLLGGALLWALGARRPSWTELLLFLGTGAAGLLSRRHIALFAIVATPIVARALVELLRPTHFYQLLHESSDEPIGGAKTAINTAMLAVGVIGLLAWDVTKLANNDKMIAKAFPVAALDHIEREGMSGQRGFNTYPWGGYIIWRGMKVFIDGRADVYGDFLGYYMKTFDLTADWRKPLDEHRVDYILLERYSRLGTLVEASGEWRETYHDDIARIFVRNSPRP